MTQTMRKLVCLTLLVLSPLFLTGCNPAMIAPILIQVSQILGAVAGIIQTVQPPPAPANTPAPGGFPGALTTTNQITETAGNVGETVNNLSGGGLAPLTAPITAVQDLGNTAQQVQEGNALDAVNQGAQTINGLTSPVPVLPIDSPGME